MMSGRVLLLSAYIYAHICTAQQDNPDIPEVIPKEQFFEYVTRPHFLIPRWRVSVLNRSALSEEGYWFTSPYETLLVHDNDKPYVGPMIYDGDGELVWGPVERFQKSKSYDFRVSYISGKECLTFISNEDWTAVVLNEAYEVMKKHPLSSSRYKWNMHEFNIVDNGTRALFIYHNTSQMSPEDSETIGYMHGRCTAIAGHIGDTDILDWDNWQTDFEWQMLDHIAFNESTADLDEQLLQFCEEPGWDFVHANAVGKCSDGNLLFSARNTDTLYKINRTDGSILWRLGGSQSDFEADLEFSRQHHARCLEMNETHTLISFLDNANGKTRDEVAHATKRFSRGLIVSINHPASRATIVSQFDHPKKLIESSRGNAQLLDNGNMFMAWGQRSLISEHTPDGKVIMSAEFEPTWLRTYRSHKLRWAGKPTAPPDVVSRLFRDRPNPEIEVFVSWNGATEVKSWNLYRSDRFGNVTDLLASSPRSGFETRILYAGRPSYVVVEGLDFQGHVLGRSVVVKTNTSASQCPSEDTMKLSAGDEEWIQSAIYRQHNPSSTRTKSFSLVWGATYLILGAVIGYLFGAGRVRFRPISSLCKIMIRRLSLNGELKDTEETTFLMDLTVNQDGK